MTHPYEGLPDSRFWRRAVSNVETHLLDPVTATSFRIAPEDKVATAGSCFAQHISRSLKRFGMTYFVAEDGEALPANLQERRQFGTFSARYGNIYTAAQLRQLLEEAYGDRVPSEKPWRNAIGNWLDPLRPTVEPDGFISIEALQEDRTRHLSAVRMLFETLDVLVFTLGLTEAWRSRIDSTVFPLAPGVAGGTFDPNTHEFVNFTASETEADLLQALSILRRVNPSSRVILTVSPVPLIATFENRNVIVSTAYSKAALRISAEHASRSLPNVDYFPSYEIITGPWATNHYFEGDLRSISPLGVAHVMRVFHRHYFDNHSPDVEPVSGQDIMSESEEAISCDEEMIESLRSR